MKNKYALITCPSCRTKYTARGFERHKNSYRCQVLTDFLPKERAIKEQRKKFREEGKYPILTVVARAIQRRAKARADILEFTGLENAYTKIVQTHTGFDIASEWWVYEWVAKLWRKHRLDSDTASFYRRLYELSYATDEERGRALGLIQLETLEI